MGATSGTGGEPADADGPALLAAEADLLDALSRLGKSASDEDFYEAVNARDAAMRRLMLQISDLPLAARELIVIRATRAMQRSSAASPADRPAPDDDVR